MNPPRPTQTAALAGLSGAPAPVLSSKAVGLLLLAAAGIPASLLWDFSWESTVGADLVWAPPHVATYLAVAMAGCTSLELVRANTRAPLGRACGVRLGLFHGPLGAWFAAWGALAFGVALLFDRWWQSTYGLVAGLWHPPQILKGIAFLAVLVGAWLLCLGWQNRTATQHRSTSAVAFAASGGLVLVLISVLTLTSIYANRQHSAPFYRFACATYPAVLVALATAGRSRWPATTAAACYTIVMGAMVWLLPLCPATPQAAPVHNSLTHLMPPPFPLLLGLPAVALDWLLRRVPWPEHRAGPWIQAGAAGAVFLLAFIGAQWLFSEFLLTDLADNRFFAGGGRHWPFFLKIDPSARTVFWENPREQLNLTSASEALGLAVFAASAGLWLGQWMRRVQR